MKKIFLQKITEFLDELLIMIRLFFFINCFFLVSEMVIRMSDKILKVILDFFFVFTNEEQAKL